MDRVPSLKYCGNPNPLNCPNHGELARAASKCPLCGSRLAWRAESGFCARCDVPIAYQLTDNGRALARSWPLCACQSGESAAPQ